MADQFEHQSQPNATDNNSSQEPTAQQDSTISNTSSTHDDQPTTSMDNPFTSQTSSQSTSESSSQYRLAPQYGAYDPNLSTDHVGEQPTQPIDVNKTQPLYTTPVSSTQQYHDSTSQSYTYGNANPYVDPNQQPGMNNPYSDPNQQPGTPNTGAPTGNNGGSNGPVFPGTPFGGPNNPTPDFNNANTAKKKGANPIAVGAISAAVAVVLSLGIGYAAVENGWVSSPASGSLSSLTTGTGGSGSTKVDGTDVNWVNVVKNVSPSVVSIATELNDGVAQGSGAVIDASNGYIVTNNHVVSGAKTIQVTLNNGDLYTADIVGTDVTTDLAVIKLHNPPSDLKAVTFADSSTLASGEPILSIGNPLGYEGTSTSGIISALNRPVTVMDEDSSTTIVTNAVQIDSSINPGNSGGPTFNAAGQVIGINSSIASTATSSSEAGSIGIGFAIPANLVKQITQEIIKDGKATHVALGITITTGTATADNVTRAGAEVKSVTSGSPAAKAGVKSGDVIVGFNGNEVNNTYSLLGFVRAEALGATAKLTVIRDGKTIELDVTFDQEESTVTGSNRSDSSNGNSGSDSNGDSNSDSNGDSGSGSNGDSNGNNRGFTDPFGLW